MARMSGRFFGTDVEDPMPWSRLATTMAGALGLGAAGAKAGAAVGSLGGPVGTGVGAVAGGAAGSIAGAGLGAASPELIMELGDALGINEPGTRERLGLSNEELKTLLEGELILEAATLGGLGAARLAGRGITRAFTGIGSKGQKLAEEATRQGINMMPVQVGKRTLPRSFVNVFGRFPFVAGPIARQGRKVDRALAQAFENLPPRIAVPASMSDVSADIFSNVKDLAVRVDAQFKAEYEEVYKLADQMKVGIRPEGTLTRAEEVLGRISAETPTAGKGQKAVRPPQSLVDLRSFIQKSVAPMRGADGTAAKQSLRQMDMLMEAIDEKVGQFVKQDVGLPLKYLEQLRNAVHKDIINLGKGQLGPGGVAPREVGRRLRAIDTRFSTTMQDLFESATAKRIGSVTKRGVGGLRYQQATSVPIEGLADIVMRGEAPSAVDELARMVPSETMKRLAASVVSRRTEQAVEHVGDNVSFNVDKFAKQMGLGAKNSPRYLQTKRLLEKAGGLSIEEVEKLSDISKAVSSVEIPDVSTFVSRRATMGGLRSATNALIPGLAVAGGSAAGQKSFAQIALGGLAFVGGGRLISSALANPDSARALRYVLQPETSRVGRKAAKWMLFRGAIWGMMEAGEISIEQVRELEGVAHTYVEEWNKFDEQSR